LPPFAVPSSSGSARAIAAPETGPNILIVITDDQRGGMEVMPRTRKLFIRGGRSYPNAFVTTPLCCPSRSSIMTGLYAHNHGILHNFHARKPHLPNDTLQANLSSLGYATAVYGKFLNQWPVNKDPAHFDDFAIMDPAYRATKWNINGRVGVLSGYTTDLVGDRAVDFIDSKRGSEQPWMMYVAPYAPHPPFRPKRAFADAKISNWRGNPALRERDRRDKPAKVREGQTTPSEGKNLRARQFRTLMSVDRMVKRVFDALRRVGQAKNTLAIYISDNGYMWGEHGLRRKGLPYTQSVKVPLFTRWPLAIRPGSVDRRLVANIDLAPTILRVLSQPTRNLDGRDLLDRSWKRNRIQLEYWCNVRECNRWASTRRKSSEYVEYYDAAGRVTFREYYNLKADKWELHNLLGDHRRNNNPKLGPLHRRLTHDRTCAGHVGRKACP